MESTNMNKINRTIFIFLSVFLFLGGVVYVGHLHGETNLVEASGPAAKGKTLNLCANAYKYGIGEGQYTSDISCEDAYAHALETADYACKAALTNAICPNAYFCSPVGLPIPGLVQYGPCGINQQGDPTKFTALVYSFCSQKCG